MDSDDTITPECGRRLRELAAADHDPAVLGYVAQVHCPGAGEEGELDVTVVDHLKLFRNRPDLRFEGRIHEQILPAIRRAGGEVAWTDIYVVHSGSDHTPEGRERKLKRDFHLLHLELAEQPEHPFTLFNLGMTYADCDRHEEAIGYLERSIAASTEGESHLRKAYALLVHSQMRAGRLGDAGASCRQGRATFPEDPELRFRQGVYFHEIGCLEEAERTYRELLDLDAERHFSSIDRGITGFKARHNLAIVLTDLSDLVAAEEQWRTIVHEVPCYRQGWRGLGDNLIRQGHLGEAQEVVLRLLIDDHLRVEGHLLDSKLCALAGDVDGAVHALETALGESSEDLEPLQSLAQLRFEHGHTVEAEQLLKELMERDPKDGASPHNLGTLYMRARRPREAVRCYQESLRRRPKSATTYLHLGQALKDLGRRTEAEAAWREALKFDPTNGAVQAELGGAESRRAKDRVEKPSVRS
jgi:tetratricopeptide (TPR) repeat protein